MGSSGSRHLVRMVTGMYLTTAWWQEQAGLHTNAEGPGTTRIRRAPLGLPFARKHPFGTGYWRNTHLHGCRIAPSAKMWPHSPCSSFWKKSLKDWERKADGWGDGITPDMISSDPAVESRREGSWSFPSAQRRKHQPRAIQHVVFPNPLETERSRFENRIACPNEFTTIRGVTTMQIVLPVAKMTLN